MPRYEKRFEDTLVGDVSDKLVLKPSRVSKDANLGEVVDQMLANPLSRKVYVTDQNGRYLGTVSTETVLRLMGYRLGIRDVGGVSFYRFLRDTLKQDIADLVTPTRSVTKDDRLVDVLEIMIKDHVNDLPVVDAEGRLIGELVSLELFLKGRELFNSEADKGGSPGSP